MSGPLASGYCEQCGKYAAKRVIARNGTGTTVDICMTCFNKSEGL